MSTYDRQQDIANRLLPRAKNKAAQIEEALRNGLSSESDVHKLGFSLAAKFPELEGIVAAICHQCNR
jgi:hypothetical protein